MIGWYHQHNGYGFGWTPGVGDGQGGLVCCSSWGHKESDMIEQVNRTEPQLFYPFIRSVQSLSHVQLFATP